MSHCLCPSREDFPSAESGIHVILHHLRSPVNSDRNSFYQLLAYFSFHNKRHIIISSIQCRRISANCFIAQSLFSDQCAQFIDQNFYHLSPVFHFFRGESGFVCNGRVVTSDFVYLCKGFAYLLNPQRLFLRCLGN